MRGGGAMLVTAMAFAAETVASGLSDVLSTGWEQLGKGVDFLKDEPIALFAIVGMPIIGKIMRRAKNLFK